MSTINSTSGSTIPTSSGSSTTSNNGGTVQSSTGLASGVNYGAIVDAIIAQEHLPIDQLQSRLKTIQTQQAAYSSVQANLLSLTTSALSLKNPSTFKALSVQSSDPSQFQITPRSTAVPGNYTLQSVRLASSYQGLSRGYATATQTVGAGQSVISRGGQLNNPLRLELLNNGAGVSRGQIKITDRSGASANVD